MLLIVCVAERAASVPAKFVAVDLRPDKDSVVTPPVSPLPQSICTSALGSANRVEFSVALLDRWK